MNGCTAGEFFSGDPCFDSGSRVARNGVGMRMLLIFCVLLPAASTGDCAEAGFREFENIRIDVPLDYDSMLSTARPCCGASGYTGFRDLPLACLQEPEEGCSDGNPDTDFRDRSGLRRDTWYFMGYQVATIGILYMMPESVSGWTDEQKEGYSLSIWWDNVTHPATDSDDFYINYLLHPYWGAAYFVRARERGYSESQSFWYSAMLSTAYEFGVEALFEEPSRQDLIVTPVLGALLGKYFMRVRRDIRDRSATRGYRTTKEKWQWVLTDPLGSLNRQVDRLFGRDVYLRVRPYVSSRRRYGDLPFDPMRRDDDRITGLQFYLRW